MQPGLRFPVAGMPIRTAVVGGPQPHDDLPAVWQFARTVGQWPFDAARLQRAGAVQAGWLRNSMLDARDFEQLLGALERVTLGPLARCN